MIKSRFFLWALAVVVTAACPGVTLANPDNKSNIMVVFDASGSMWGQIDSVTKIEIAREAFAQAQAVWNDGDQSVGLMAYGHRRKGDCRDIEMLVPLGANNGAKIAGQVQSLRPKGKTPLTDALRLAAQELRYREEVASVILFSDGIESCNADPCALAKELEQDGINFTAHVIGFGLGQAADRAQLQCIADNTGGSFVEARDATSLVDALSRVAAAPEPAQIQEQPVQTVQLRITIATAGETVRPHQVSIRATDMATGKKQILGSLTGAGQVLKGLTARLPLGEWTLEAINEEGSGARTITLQPDLQEVSIPFKAKDTGFVLIGDGPYRLGVDHLFFLGVTDPLQVNAEYTVALYPAGATDQATQIDWETRFGSDKEGYTEHTFAAPQAGDYEIIVVQGDDLSKAKARFPVTFEANAPIRWLGETHGEPGQSLGIKISGDMYRNNTLSLRDSAGNDVVSKWLQDYVTKGKLAELTLPNTPGIYELFYRATSEEGEISLGQITVGDVILEDDPDAVEPPEGVDEASAPAASGSQTQFQCQQPICSYDSAMLKLKGIPILQGFGIANEAFTDAGQPSFDVVNLANGDLITLNPLFMVSAMDCHTVSENGRLEGMETDRLCLIKDSTGPTVTQFETLEFWVADANEKTLEADLAAERAKHDATMGEDKIFTSSSLQGGWSLRDQQSSQVVAVVAIDTAGEGVMTMDLLVYSGTATGLDGAKQYQVAVHPATRDTTELLALSGMGDDVIVQLSRPPDWDGGENVFSGFLTLTATGKTLRVEMF